MTDIKMLKRDQNIIDIARRLGFEFTEKYDKAAIDCPFCDDHSGHLYLYRKTNRFWCFKCQAKGDSLDFYSKVRRIALKDALNELSPGGQHQTQPDWRSSIIQHLTKPKSEPTPAKDHSALFFDIIAPMRITDKGRDYLIGRGIPDSLIRRYDIKSIADPRKFADDLKARFPLDDLLDSGLFDYSANGKLYCTFFMPAILFPHFDKGCTRITYLSSRNLAGQSKAFKLHSVESQPHFGQLDPHHSEIFIFEGIINGLSYEAITGQNNWAALCGLISLSKYTALMGEFPGKKLILGLDPDDAGNRALNEIKARFKVTWIEWGEFARMRGFDKPPKHPSGKPYDLNDYLTQAQGDTK